jgi:uncharacterized protein YjiS (DUF1127 family)
MIPTHRDLHHLIERLSAPATLAAAGDGRAAAPPVVASRSQAGLGSTALRALARVVAAGVAWRERARQRSALMELSDYMLCDIGVSRAAAIDEAAKPFWRS